MKIIAVPELLPEHNPAEWVEVYNERSRRVAILKIDVAPIQAMDADTVYAEDLTYFKVDPGEKYFVLKSHYEGE